MRNLTKTLVAVSMLTSTSVHSLGIGGIKLRSALNQNLNAEIALVISNGESIGDVQVKLASPAKFDEAGVPWSYFLTKIKFTPIAKNDGSVVVKLTSNEALKEPFLNFLVEVTGPSGSLFREFTVLVDPPVAYKPPVVPVIAAAEPDAIPTNNFSEPAAPQPESFSQKNIEAVEPEENAGYIPVTEYGPVRKGETIRSIANQVKAEDVSTAQMMMAIYKENPRAFSAPNVNALMAGEMLAIPDPEEALRVAPRQALAEVRQQRQSWRLRNAPVHEVSEQPPVAENKPKNPQPKPLPDPVAASSAEPVKQLKLNPPPEEEDVVHGGVQGDDAKNKASGEDAGASAALDDAALKQRFDKIEQQLLLMQKMLELKDAQLANLQNQNKALPAIADTLPKLAEPPASSQPVAEILPVNPLETKPALETKPVPENSVKPLAKNEPVAVVPPVVKAVPTQAQSPVTSSSASLFSDYSLLAGALGAVLLGALGLVWWRKRKVEQEIDTESMFASASQISLPDAEKETSSTTDNSSGYEVAVVGGGSAFLSEFTPSEFDAFETDQTEIDPLSEADVYLAYGRYQQAEELIRQVIAEHPGRNDCKLKLLEIFHTSENHREFDQYVQQLTNEGKQADTAFWAKVVELSNEFTSGSGSLTGLSGASMSTLNSSSKTANFATQVDNGFKPASDDFDLNTFSDNGEFAAKQKQSVKIEKVAVKPVVKAATLGAAESSAIFLDQDQNKDSVLDAKTGELEATDDLSNTDYELDFDLDAFASEPLTSQDENLELINEDNTHTLDFDISSFATENSISENDFSALDFDLSSFDENVDSAGIKNSIGRNDKNLSGSGININSKSVAGLSSSTSESKFYPDEGTNLNSAFAGLEDDIPDSFDFVLDKQDDGKSTINTAELDFNFIDEQEIALNDFDFSGEDFNLKPGAEVVGKKLDLDAAEDFDFNFDFTPPSGDAPKKQDKPFESVEVGDLTDSENVFETKVNLANAYVDMGDVDAAKDIANDLLKGTAEQKKAGLEILEKIS
ncbi:MAG: FimV/HubP family polar landmark protein [Methylococcales bacterium]